MYIIDSFEIKIYSSLYLPVLMYFQLFLSCFAVTHTSSWWWFCPGSLTFIYLRVSWAKSRISAQKIVCFARSNVIWLGFTQDVVTVLWVMWPVTVVGRVFQVTEILLGTRWRNTSLIESHISLADQSDLKHARL